MEPLQTLTARAIATLAFQKFIESGAGELAKKFTEGAIQRMNELYSLVKTRLSRQPKVEKVFAEIEETGSKEALNRLAVYLGDEMEDDPAFAAQVQAIAQEISAGRLVDRSSMTQNIYDQAKGWQTKVEGGTAYIGEIYIHGKPE